MILGLRASLFIDFLLRRDLSFFHFHPVLRLDRNIPRFPHRLQITNINASLFHLLKKILHPNALLLSLKNAIFKGQSLQAKLLAIFVERCTGVHDDWLVFLFPFVKSRVWGLGLGNYFLGLGMRRLWSCFTEGD